jgi:hypothetical protein
MVDGGANQWENHKNQDGGFFSDRMYSFGLLKYHGTLCVAAELAISGNEP